jgi:hypothetical protein
MSEMIERVAMSLRDALPKSFIVEDLRAAARAAIKAMREPTKEMLIAAETPITYDWSGAGVSPNPHVAWLRMIDFALRPSTPDKAEHSKPTPDLPAA